MSSTPRLEDQSIDFTATYRQVTRVDIQRRAAWNRNACWTVVVQLALVTLFVPVLCVVASLTAYLHWMLGCCVGFAFVVLLLNGMRRMGMRLGRAPLVGSRIAANRVGVALREPNRPVYRYRWEQLAYRLDDNGERLTLFTQGRPIYHLSLGNRKARTVAYVVAVAVARTRMTAYRQQLAGGGGVRFGDVTLWHDRLQLGESGPVIMQEAIGFWRQDGRGFYVNSAEGQLLGAVALERLLNPDLLYELLGEWGDDTVLDGTGEDVIVALAEDTPSSRPTYGSA